MSLKPNADGTHDVGGDYAHDEGSHSDSEYSSGMPDLQDGSSDEDVPKVPDELKQAYGAAQVMLTQAKNLRKKMMPKKAPRPL